MTDPAEKSTAGQPAAGDENDRSREADANAPSSAEGTPHDAEIDELKARADENWDRYLRTAAELENVRKRASRDVENARKYALENFARDLLAVLDSFEMGLSLENADTAALREGSEATLKQLLSVLERANIQPIDPVGEPFDPELHEAISTQPSAEMEPNSVLAVVQKGYTINDRLLRAARVVVSTEPPSADDNDGR
jgi:molecular chaperone GrpE